MTVNRDRSDEWDRTEWEGEGQDDLPREAAPRDEVPPWNKQQWEGEGQDDFPEEAPAPQPMGEGNSEYSGHGHNPGGGKRWARVDRGDEEQTE